MISPKVQAQIQVLKTTFGKLERISDEAGEKLLKIIHESPEEACVAMVEARIKFCWMPALNRLQNHFKWSRERVQTLLRKQQS
jgi:hypothetical protein